jgi:crossover junction endodeoxyribonuclease RuvC
VVILGIDPGSGVTGYGCVEYTRKTYRFIECGCIRTDAGLPFPERLERIYDGLVELIGVRRPDEAAIEDVFMNRDVRGALKIGQVRGVAMLAVVKSGVPIFEYSPAEVKRAVVGSGSASKEQVQFMIRHLLRLDELPKPSDAADALAIALCHAHRVEQPERVVVPVRRGKRDRAFWEKLTKAQ